MIRTPTKLLPSSDCAAQEDTKGIEECRERLEVAFKDLEPLVEGKKGKFIAGEKPGISDIVMIFPAPDPLQCTVLPHVHPGTFPPRMQFPMRFTHQKASSFPSRCKICAHPFKRGARQQPIVSPSSSFTHATESQALAALCAPVVMPPQNYGGHFAAPFAVMEAQSEGYRTVLEHFRDTVVGKHVLMVYADCRPAVSI